VTEPSPITFHDLAEILWLPALIGMVAAAVTWLIWYYTSVPCTPEATVLHHCNPARIARYVSVDIWAKCLTLGTLTGGLIGGGVNYAMFSRERAARIAAEIMAAEANKRADEERKLREEDRKRIDQLIVQFGETQQAMMSAITALTSEVAEMRRQRTNGSNGG